MNKLSTVRKSVITAACIALCLVLPLMFHAVPNAGALCCPIHIPVLLCGLVCGGLYGLLCGLAGPLLSCLFTGMPAAALLPAMLAECAVYGVAAGLLMKLIHTKKTYTDVCVSLVSAMVLGRIAAGCVRALLFAGGSYSVSAWAAAYLLGNLPGMIIQLALIPAAVTALERAELIPQRTSE